MSNLCLVTTPLQLLSGEIFVLVWIIFPLRRNPFAFGMSADRLRLILISSDYKIRDWNAIIT